MSKSAKNTWLVIGILVALEILASIGFVLNSLFAAGMIVVGLEKGFNNFTPIVLSISVFVLFGGITTQFFGRNLQKRWPHVLGTCVGVISALFFSFILWELRHVPSLGGDRHSLFVILFGCLFLYNLLATLLDGLLISARVRKNFERAEKEMWHEKAENPISAA